MIYLANAFSLQMLEKFPCTPTIEECDKNEIVEHKDELVSAIGHTDLAVVLTDDLDFYIATNRCNVKMKSGDTLYVAQLMGGRLPEGSTTLPEGFNLKYFKIRV